MISSSSTKAIISGHHVEVYQTEKPIRYSFPGRGGRPNKRKNTQAIDYSIRKQTVRKTRQNISRLFNANFNPHMNEHNHFITLTFKEGSLPNLNDISSANRLFKHFIQRLRYHFRNEPAFKYIAIVDFQDRHGREAIHYHVIVNTPPIPQAILAKIWRHGHVWIGKIKNFERVRNYITKHLSLIILDERFFGQKLYLPSPNLDKPITLRGNIADNLAASLELQVEEDYSYEYISEYHGKCQYKTYNLSKVWLKGYVWKDMTRYLKRMENHLSFQLYPNKLPLPIPIHFTVTNAYSI